MVPVAENAIYRHGDEFTEQLARGLADNWSQVGHIATYNAVCCLMSGSHVLWLSWALPLTMPLMYTMWPHLFLGQRVEEFLQPTGYYFLLYSYFVRICSWISKIVKKYAYKHYSFPIWHYYGIAHAWLSPDAKYCLVLSDCCVVGAPRVVCRYQTIFARSEWRIASEVLPGFAPATLSQSVSALVHVRVKIAGNLKKLLMVHW